MGYSTRSCGNIRTFWPDDTENSFYIESSASIQDILDRARRTWPQADLNNIRIEAQHIHTDCLGYDQYDSSDYTNFLCISLES